ncbi:CrcB family protein [Nonlabens ponticola]|uniref:Fluoride-specific ion channel FluC n=1 Tax=Nonlabens ponticola TaxID=2496866 RepID=A0A3S9N1H7_9FLAO|nr:CrcB family protein [Nonlabens ponticola]
MGKLLVLVFVGGGLGSTLRYSFSLWLNQDGIKWIPTMLVNVLGCLLLGTLLAYYNKEQLSSSWYLFAAVGFCGGLTTFSTFSAEFFLFLKDQNYIAATGYVAATIVLGIAAITAAYAFTGKLIN